MLVVHDGVYTAVVQMFLTLKSLSSIYHMYMRVNLDYGALFWAVHHVVTAYFVALEPLTGD